MFVDGKNNSKTDIYKTRVRAGLVWFRIFLTISFCDNDNNNTLAFKKAGNFFTG